MLPQEKLNVQDFTDVILSNLVDIVHIRTPKLKYK